MVFVKTAAGLLEIRDRRLGLARTARTLLVLVDGVRTHEQLLQMLQGATADSFDVLLAYGLIEPASRVVPALRVPARPAQEDDPIETRDETAENEPADPAPVGSELGYRELYDSLTSLAKDQLGLFKGYRFALEIEKARDLAELQDVAQRFVAEVLKGKGEAAAQTTRRALGLSR